MKTVYLPIGVDMIHHGHINIITEGAKLGRVVIGLQTDRVISSYKRFPLLDFEQRKLILSNIVGVSEVVAQEDIYGIENIKRLRPDYYIHGDDWKDDLHRQVRQKVMDALEEVGGTLVEIPYTKGVSVEMLDHRLNEIGTTPTIRRWKLRQMLNMKPLLRFLEAHDGLSGLIAEKVKVEDENGIRRFDGMWSSSLCDSTIMGKPDIELVDLSTRVGRINEIMEVTTKPIIFDADTGGKKEHFVYTVKTLERLGVSALIIEDKIGLKKNSLFGTDVVQQQDDIESFCEKIKVGKQAQVTNDFMVIARIESLILKQGLEDAVKRAKAYVEAGADGIMIHSKEKDPGEVLEFCRRYRALEKRVPLVAVPSSYNEITERELEEAGVNIVIYANHLIRAAYPAMLKTAESILKHGRCYEASQEILSIKEILTLIPGGK